MRALEPLDKVAVAGALFVGIKEAHQLGGG